jgi:hypothetical protein
MIDWDVESSPQTYARIGGALYLINIALGVVGEVVRDRLAVNDVAATATNLRSMESLWRVGVTCELAALVAATALAMIYYVLLKPVSRELNLLATFLRLVAIAVEAVVALNLVEALFPLGSAPYLQAFTPEQLAAMTRLAVRSFGYGFGVALLLFGFCFLVHGFLIFKSGFLPKVLGVLIQVAGVCYLTNSFALLLAPALEDRMFPLILLPAFVGEASLCVWLLVKGVDVEMWRQANARLVRRRLPAS